MLTPCSPSHVLVTETTQSPSLLTGGISCRKLSEFKLSVSQHPPKRSLSALSQH